MASRLVVGQSLEDHRADQCAAQWPGCPGELDRRPGVAELARPQSESLVGRPDIDQQGPDGQHSLGRQRVRRSAPAVGEHGTQGGGNRRGVGGAERPPGGSRRRRPRRPGPQRFGQQIDPGTDHREPGAVSSSGVTRAVALPASSSTPPVPTVAGSGTRRFRHSPVPMPPDGHRRDRCGRGRAGPGQARGRPCGSGVGGEHRRHRRRPVRRPAASRSCGSAAVPHSETTTDNARDRPRAAFSIAARDRRRHRGPPGRDRPRDPAPRRGAPPAPPDRPPDRRAVPGAASGRSSGAVGPR